MSSIKIGWIGLGKMGNPMSQHLINAGYPVAVFNRSKEKEDALKAKGAEPVSSPSNLIQQSDVIIIMVSDDKAIYDIFSGAEGLLHAGVTGKIIINMSTVSSAISKEMALLCNQQGNHYLDAPVSGSVKQAEGAQLVVMVGGEKAVYEQVKEVLDHLGKLTLYVGETGAGNATKLAVNSLIGFYAQGLSEAVIFANQNQIRTEDLLTVINNSALANVFTKFKGDAILNDNFEPAFYLKHIVKDLGLARDQGLTTPLADTAYHSFLEAEKTMAEEDMISIFRHLSQSK